MNKVIVLNCLHCKHEWPSRLKRRPKVCPNCKSYNWDKPEMSKKRVNIYTDVKLYRGDGTIIINNARCKVTKNLQDTIILNSPKEGYHLHLYPKGGIITDEDKDDKRDRHKNITKKEFEEVK